MPHDVKRRTKQTYAATKILPRKQTNNALENNRWIPDSYEYYGEKKKYKAHISKYVWDILKYLRHNFYLLPCRYKILNISFHFFCSENGHFRGIVCFGCFFFWKVKNCRVIDFGCRWKNNPYRCIRVRVVLCCSCCCVLVALAAHWDACGWWAWAGRGLAVGYIAWRFAARREYAALFLFGLTVLGGCYGFDWVALCAF